MLVDTVEEIKYFVEQILTPTLRLRDLGAHCQETVCFRTNKEEVQKKTEQNVNLEERFLKTQIHSMMLHHHYFKWRSS